MNSFKDHFYFNPKDLDSEYDDTATYLYNPNTHMRLKLVPILLDDGLFYEYYPYNYDDNAFVLDQHLIKEEEYNKLLKGFRVIEQPKLDFTKIKDWRGFQA